MSTETLTDVLARYATPREASLGRPLTSPRDVLDMLVALKGHDAFWHDLQVARPVEDADFSQLRAALPNAPFAPQLPVERCLATLGVDAGDIPVVLDDTPATEAVSDAISAAFSADSPTDVARALENLLAQAPIRSAAQRMPVHSSLARGIGLVFLVCSLAGLALGSLTACYKGVTPEA